MSKFEKDYGLVQGDSILVIGPPGTGKSTFASSVCGVVPPERVKLLCPKPRERSSWGYKHYGLDKTGELFYDQDWKPELGQYGHKAWKALLQRLAELYHDDSIDAVILDAGTDAALLKKHELFGKQKISSTAELREKGKSAVFGFWEQYSSGVAQLIGSLVELTVAPHPKFVICTWHAQPPKDGIGEGEAAKYEGIEFEGNVLPMLDGSYRRKIAGDFSVVVYSELRSSTKLVDGKMQSEDVYSLRVKASADKHAKVAGTPAWEEAFIPNEFKILFEALK